MGTSKRTPSGGNVLVRLPIAEAAVQVLDEAKQLAVSNREVRRSPLDLPHAELGLQKTRAALFKFVEDGNLSGDVLSLLLTADGFLPVEGVIVDYKRDVPSDAGGLVRLLRHIAAFHNTYGGYLVLGAEELEKDKVLVPVHESVLAFESKQLRDLVREYLGTPIEVQAANHQVDFSGVKYQMILVHVPKRTRTEPVVFRRNGPQVNGKGLMFAREQVFLRDGDNSVAASTTYHWQLIFSARQNPYAGHNVTSVTVWSNLPDRALICQDFIGRKNIISMLYEWLADDFSCVRVLAGEGGLGKTSIAYEFASDVARLGLVGVESVIWLSAKKWQFRPLINQYEALSLTHFSSSRELFEELVKQIGGANAEEVSETSDAQMARLIRRLLRGVRIFAVVDDLDSLDLDEQKHCIEVCQQLAGEGSRFLFTTRKNATASSTTAIELQGLDENEYPALIDSWRTRLALPEFSAKEIARLRDATLGSPLYTESLLRLIRSGFSANDAIAKWKGNLGVEVRNAALKREVVQLTPESKKVLVTVAIFGECSFAEVKKATSYSDQTLLDCFNELQSLFLVSAPSIAQQARFGISSTTRELVLSSGAELLPGFSGYRKTAEENRYKIRGAKLPLDIVGAAINQAAALLASKDPDQVRQALETVDEVNAKLGGKNPDLLSMRGSILRKMGPTRSREAAASFRDAFEAGQRKMPFFKAWYDNESMAEQYEPAVDVATFAIDASSGPKFEWLLRRAHARIASAASQDRKGDTEHARAQLSAAAEDLHQCRVSNPDMEWDVQRNEYLYKTHDTLWQIDTRGAGSVPAYIQALDGQVEALERGDRRIDVYERVAQALSSLFNLMGGDHGKLTQREFNLLEQKTRECLAQLKKAPGNLRTMRAFIQIQRTAEELSATLQ